MRAALAAALLFLAACPAAVAKRLGHSVSGPPPPVPPFFEAVFASDEAKESQQGSDAGSDAGSNVGSTSIDGFPSDGGFLDDVASDSNGEAASPPKAKPAARGKPPGKKTPIPPPPKQPGKKMKKPASKGDEESPGEQNLPLSFPTFGSASPPDSLHGSPGSPSDKTAASQKSLAGCTPSRWTSQADATWEGCRSVRCSRQSYEFFILRSTGLSSDEAKETMETQSYCTKSCTKRRCACYDMSGDRLQAEAVVDSQRAAPLWGIVPYAWSASKPQYRPFLSYALPNGTVETVEVLPTNFGNFFVRGECYFTLLAYLRYQFSKYGLPPPRDTFCAFCVEGAVKDNMVTQFSIATRRLINEPDRVLRFITDAILKIKTESPSSMRDSLKRTVTHLQKMRPRTITFEDAITGLEIVVEVEKVLGTGRSGAVFQVQAHRLMAKSKEERQPITLAMKVIYGRDTESEVLQEFTALQQLDGCDGTCVRLFHGKVSAVPVFLVEEVAGPSLKDVLADMSQITPIQIMNWLGSLIKFQFTLKAHGLWCPDQHLDNFIVVSHPKALQGLKCIDLGRMLPAPEGDELAPTLDENGERNIAAVRWFENLVAALVSGFTKLGVPGGEAASDWCHVIGLLTRIESIEVAVVIRLAKLKPECVISDSPLNPRLLSHTKALLDSVELLQTMFR